MPSRAVVWFRRDLRVTDHRALLAALDAATVWCSQEYTPYARRRDRAVERALGADGRALHPCPAST